MDRYRRSAESARTLVLVAMIVQIIFFVIGVAVFIIAIIALTLGVAQSSTPTDQVILIISAVFGFLFIFGSLWIFLNYFLVYKQIVADDLVRAEGPALALGIIELIFDGIIPGILLIIAYSKIGDALLYREMEKEKKTG